MSAKYVVHLDNKYRSYKIRMQVLNTVFCACQYRCAKATQLPTVTKDDAKQKPGNLHLAVRRAGGRQLVGMRRAEAWHTWRLWWQLNITPGNALFQAAAGHTRPSQTRLARGANDLRKLLTSIGGGTGRTSPATPPPTALRGICAPG